MKGNVSFNIAVVFMRVPYYVIQFYTNICLLLHDLFIQSMHYIRPVETGGPGWGLQPSPPPPRFLLNSIFDESEKIVLK